MEKKNSIASVVGNCEALHVLIVGAGRGGGAFLDVFSHYDWIYVDAIVDQDADAPALATAMRQGLQTSTDIDGLLAGFTGDVVIDVTGNQAMNRDLVARPELQSKEIISGKSAKLMFDLVREQIEDKFNMCLQTARLDLLDALLETTMQLETTSFSQLARSSLEALHGHFDTLKGMAVLFENRQRPEIVGTLGMASPILTDAIFQRLKAIVDLERPTDSALHQLSVSIVMPDAEINVLIPLCYEGQLVAALLFEVPMPMVRAHRTVLEIASSHIFLAAKSMIQRQYWEDLAFRDGLTMVFNRRYFMENLHNEIHRLRRNPQAALACIFLDLDDFKHVNDHFGHPAGDRVLQYLVECVQASVREYDLVARYGGDEFVALMALDGDGATQVVEAIGHRILELVRSGSFPEYAGLQASVSIGIVVQPSATLSDGATLLAKADQAVYQAKASGKNMLHIL
ncbi:MAG: GGDEF domain-containing protein [Mariprofundales bacterium]